ncbi:MAG: aspartate aminotransferase family protein [Pseudomonadales bacterium]
MNKVNWPFIPGNMPEIVSAQGVYLFDASGRRVLDAAGGAIVVNVGHGRERVVEKVAEATRRTTYVVPPWITPSRRALVEVLERHWLPEPFTHIHLTSGGSESVESAVKLALQYHVARDQPERSLIIARSPSYHGTTLATAGLSGHAARKRGLEPVLARHPVAPTPYPLRCPLGREHPEMGAYYADALEDAITSAGANRVAAVLAEPITGASGGALVPPDDYWPRVREICDRHGVLLIMDEVMTGFGRTGAPFAFQHWDFTPDILVGGKGLAGGYAPLGGVFASTRVGEAIRAAKMNVMFHTFGGHPAACAAAAEVLTILVEESLTERAREMGALLGARLEAVLGGHPHVAEIRGRGLLMAVEIVRDRETLAPYDEVDNVTSRIVGKALERGVFFYGGGTGEFRDIVCMGPPFIIDAGHVETMVETLAAAIDDVCS